MYRPRQLHGQFGEFALLLVAISCAVLMSIRPASGASSVTTVSASVLSSSTLDTSGCRSPGALVLGSLTVSSWAIGDVCRLGFGSSNDTSRLRLWQRDGRAPALESTATTWTPRSGSTRWNAVGSGTTVGTAWIGGVGGPGEPSVRLLATTDGGAAWTTQAPCDGRAPIDIDPISDTLVYALTSNSVCRTVDGGATWVTVLSASGLTRMDMADATTGYVVGSNRVYGTTNGLTFPLIHTNATFSSLTSVSATPTGRVVITGRSSQLPLSDYGVVVSGDAGATWTSTILATGVGFDTSGVYGSLAITDSILFIGTPRGRWRSIDGGATWPVAPGGAFSGEPFVRSDGEIFINSGSDSIQRSSDQGATWTTVQMNTGGSAHMRQISGAGMTELWVVGYSNRRIRSVDGGASWALLDAVKPAYYAVAAWDDQRWVVAGESGLAMATSDGGATFTPVNLGTTRTIVDGATFPRGTGVLIANQTVLRTTDSGASWTPVTVPGPLSSWTRLDVDDDGVAWMVSTNGVVATSSDQGETWVLRDAVPGAPSTTSISTWGGTVWVGTTAGVVWSSNASPPMSWTSSTPQARAVNDIWAINATTAVALFAYDAPSATSSIFRTTDRGSTWIQTPVLNHSTTIATDGAHKLGWIGTSTNHSRSEDLGLTWSSGQSVAVNEYIQRFAVLNGGRLLAVGSASLISTSDPIVTVPDGMSGASGFGACLETAAGTLAGGWSPAGSGNCTAALPASWMPIAASEVAPTAHLASTSTSGYGTLDLRFGFKVGTSTLATAYASNLVFEVIAPAS